MSSFRVYESDEYDISGKVTITPADEWPTGEFSDGFVVEWSGGEVRHDEDGSYAGETTGGKRYYRVLPDWLKAKSGL